MYLGRHLIAMLAQQLLDRGGQGAAAAGLRVAVVPVGALGIGALGGMRLNSCHSRLSLDIGGLLVASIGASRAEGIDLAQAEGDRVSAAAFRGRDQNSFQSLSMAALPLER